MAGNRKVDRDLDLLDVYLRALQLAAEVDVAGLPLGEDFERRNAGFAMTVARVLGPAERQVDLCANRWRVDVEDPGVEIAHRDKCAVDVLRVDRRRESVLDTVGDRNRLVQ